MLLYLIIIEMSRGLKMYADTFFVKTLREGPHPLGKERRLAAREYANLKKQEADIAERLEAERDKIAAFMGEADTLVGVDGLPLVTWKTGKDRSTTDWKTVAMAAGATEAQIAASTVIKPGNRTFLSKIK